MLDGVPLESALKWIDTNTPLTREALARLRERRYGEVTLAYAGHVEPKMISHLLALQACGVDVIVTPCVPGIAHAESFAFLKRSGMLTLGETAASWAELEAAWDQILAKGPHYLFDIGGGLIKRAVDQGVRVRAACEATSTGIDLVRTLKPQFPVFNWNDVPVKTLMHNRYEVGSGVWYAFRKLTGLDLCRLRVGVVGYGLVGQSVAATARGLGAQVFVSEREPIRGLTAASDGYGTMRLRELASRVDVLVSATGARATIEHLSLSNAKDGLMIANAGHDSRDIDLSALKASGEVVPGVAAFTTTAGRMVYLLCEGRLLNLAAGGGSAVNTFDLVTALITNVVDYMLTSGATAGPGLRDVPVHVSADLVRAAANEALTP